MANLSNINNVLRVSSNLRVGINTDAASYALEIGGTNSGIKLKNSGASGKVYSILSDTSGNFQIYDDAAASGRLVINSAGNATFVGNVTIDHSTNADSTLKLHAYSSVIGDAYAWNLTAENSANSYAFRILQGTSPVFTIANTASGAALGNATFAGNITGIGATFIGTAASGAALVTIENNSGSTATSYGLLVKGGGDSASGKTFEVRDDSGNTDLIVKGNGNVGIGADSPLQKLQVQTGTDTDGIIITGDGTAMSTGQYRRLGFRYSSTDSSYSSEIRFEVPNGTAHGGAINFMTHIAGTPSFQSNMYLDENGRVGIGTITPGAKLQIGSATHAPNGNLSNNLLQIKSPSSWAYLTIGNGDTANSTAYIGGASGFLVLGSVTDAGALSEHIRVQSSGNVGIGTTSPGYPLDVFSVEVAARFTGSQTGHTQGAILLSSGTADTPQARGQGVYRFNEGNDDTWYTGTAYANTNKYIWARKASTTSFDSGTASLTYAMMTLTNGGNLGIGTTNPDQTGYGYKTLTIMGGTTAGYAGVLELLAPTTDANGQNLGIVSFGSGGTRNAMIGAVRQSGNNNGKLQFWTSAGANGIENRMSIDADGNVGIGTDSPSTKLDVNGQMTHDGLVMKSGDGVYVDRYLVYTLNISLIASTWVDTGIYSNSGSYQLGASGTYAVQIYSDSHAGEPYWYSAYWSGIMSWHQGSVNQNAVFEIPLTQAAHSTNNRPLELRIQNTLGSGPGTPTNNARLEVKTTAAGTNSATLSFRFRRLI